MMKEGSTVATRLWTVQVMHAWRGGLTGEYGFLKLGGDVCVVFCCLSGHVLRSHWKPRCGKDGGAGGGELGKQFPPSHPGRICGQVHMLGSWQASGKVTGRVTGTRVSGCGVVHGERRPWAGRGRQAPGFSGPKRRPEHAKTTPNKCVVRLATPQNALQLVDLGSSDAGRRSPDVGSALFHFSSSIVSNTSMPIEVRNCGSGWDVIGSRTIARPSLKIFLPRGAASGVRPMPSPCLDVFSSFAQRKKFSPFANTSARW